MKSKYVLGINAFHPDSSACIFRDDELLFAVEEERLNRVKHWSGFPKGAIEYCLKVASISIDDVNAVAINSNPASARSRKIIYALKHWYKLSQFMSRYRQKKEKLDILDHFRRVFPDARLAMKIFHVDHHAAHLLSAWYCAPNDEAALVSVDGFGDFASMAWGVYDSGEVRVEQKTYYPHSIGIFYQAITQFLGFPNYGDEYKMMGLSSYGTDYYASEMQKLIWLDENNEIQMDLSYFKHHLNRQNVYSGNAVDEDVVLYSNKLEKLLGNPREAGAEITQVHKDIAASAQRHYERLFQNLVDNILLSTDRNAIAVAGGCGMNSVANGKILGTTRAEKIYVQPAAGDAGGALGAALYALDKLEIPIRRKMEHAYIGPEFTEEQIEEVLLKRKSDLDESACCYRYVQSTTELLEIVVSSLIDGGVIGWFQGAVEWGPRALGNRSILADPRRADVKDILNLKIKRRESFRPFAPSVLSEHVSQWFETTDDVPYMMQVYPVRKEKRALVPAITHVDGSGRLQSVYAASNQKYHDLISKFCEKTGIPMLVNTSFNENEPIVCRPEEALDCFLRTKMDILVMGNWLVTR